MLFNVSGGAARRRNGHDLVISLTADQAEALGTDLDLAEALDTVLVALAALRTGHDPKVPRGTPSVKDKPYAMGIAWNEWVLSEVSMLLTRLTGLRDAMIRQHAERGGSYGQLAIALGVPRATAQHRRDDLGFISPAELWAAGEYAPASHPGSRVPDALRPWSVPWPGYTPVDITPPELRSSRAAAAEHWVRDTETDPTAVAGLADRQARAIVPFGVDDRGRPLNPSGRTGRTGRNLGAWDENASVDPVVLAGTGPGRQVLLILRDDCGKWAIPGGHVDPGETVTDALPRELYEEAGVRVSGVTPRIVARTLVNDPRDTDHAWIATVVAVYQLPMPVSPTAGSDAADARWWPASSLDALIQAITAAGGELYPAHHALLRKCLAGPDWP